MAKGAQTSGCIQAVIFMTRWRTAASWELLGKQTRAHVRTWARSRLVTFTRHHAPAFAYRS